MNYKFYCAFQINFSSVLSLIYMKYVYVYVKNLKLCQYVFVCTICYFPDFANVHSIFLLHVCKMGYDNIHPCIVYNCIPLSFSLPRFISSNDCHVSLSFSLPRFISSNDCHVFQCFMTAPKKLFFKWLSLKPPKLQKIHFYGASVCMHC